MTRATNWQATRKLIVRNLSTRTMRLGSPRTTSTSAAGRGLGLRRRSHAARDRARSLGTRLRHGAGIALAGTERSDRGRCSQVRPEGGAALRVPWLSRSAPTPTLLLGELQLSEARFEPSDAAPGVFSFRAGQVERVRHGWQMQPVAQLDLELRRANGERLGVLARLRDLLPGHYSFGLTGRDAEGERARSGRYRLRLTAWPTGDGQAEPRIGCLQHRVRGRILAPIFAC